MLAGFFVTIIVALLVAVHFIDWNAQRSWVANRLSDALARPVSIERGLDIALFPSPHVVVRDLMVGTSFANAGFELAKIGHGELRLDFPQLLKGKLEPTKFPACSADRTSFSHDRLAESGTTLLADFTRINVMACRGDTR